MTRKTRLTVVSIAVALVLLTVSGIVALNWKGLWEIGTLGTGVTVETSTTREGVPIDMPRSARNIRYAGYAGFQAYADYLRFEAPLPDCKAWAAGFKDQVGPMKPMTYHESAVPGTDEGMDVSWFDIHLINNGITAGGGSHVPQIWVDLDRGVCYYRLLD